MTYTLITIDAPFLTRRSFEVGRGEGGTGRASLFGGSTTVLLQLAEHPDAELILAWEPPPTDEPSERREVFADYKAQRRAPPVEYLQACDAFKDLVELLGFAQVHAPGLEADDAVASLVAPYLPFFVDAGAPTGGPSALIWSADKDLLQLVNPRVHMIRPTSGREIITPETIVERTGHTPDQWTAILTLAGDTADGIPGLPRVGLERAKRLIAACPQLLDWLLEGGDEARAGSLACVAASDPKSVQWVEVAWSHRELALQCYDLVRLRTPTLVRREGHRDLQAAAEVLRQEGVEYLVPRVFTLERDPWLDDPTDYDPDNLPF